MRFYHNWRKTHWKQRSTGERRARKLARGVRRRAGGKGRRKSYLACGLSYFAIGIIGSFADAEPVRQQVTAFIQETLKLTIAEEKSHIRHSKKGMIFVGYEVKTYSGDRVVKVVWHPPHYL